MTFSNIIHGFDYADNIIYKDNDKTTANDLWGANLQEDPELHFQILGPFGSGKLLEGLPGSSRDK